MGFGMHLIASYSSNGFDQEALEVSRQILVMDCIVFAKNNYFVL